MITRKSFYAVVFVVVTIAIGSALFLVMDQTDSTITAIQFTASQHPTQPLRLTHGEQDFKDWVEQAGPGETRSVSVDSNGIIHFNSVNGLEFGSQQLNDNIKVRRNSRFLPPDIIGSNEPSKALGRGSD